jgi:hypothetical protein
MSDAATAEGSFHVKIEVLDKGLTDPINAGGPVETRVPGITPDLLSKIPRRISDPAGKPGDMVNVLIVGTQDQMVHAFTTAEWVQVDKTVGNTALNAVMDSLEKKDYLTMPMSTLFLFNRPQDYGFAHGEPVRVAMSRNHLRVWKSPYEVDGRPCGVWRLPTMSDSSAISATTASPIRSIRRLTVNASTSTARFPGQDSSFSGTTLPPPIR